MYSTSLHLLFSSDYVLILLLLFTDTAKLVLKKQVYRDVGLIQGHSECHMFEAVHSCSGGKVLKKCQHQVYNVVVVHVRNISMHGIE